MDGTTYHQLTTPIWAVRPRFWTEYFHCSEDELHAALRAAGDAPWSIQSYLQTLRAERSERAAAEETRKPA